MALLHATVWKENLWFIAQCLEIDVCTQGGTESEALENLIEAMRLYYDPPVASNSFRFETLTEHIIRTFELPEAVQ